MGAVKRQGTISLDSQIWKSLEDFLPKLYCADLTEAYVTQGEYELEACVKKILRAEAKAMAVAKIVPSRKPHWKAHLSSHPRLLCPAT